MRTAITPVQLPEPPDIPNYLLHYPAQLALEEKALYYYVAKTLWDCDGDVYDFGTLAGGTTVALALGYTANSRFNKWRAGRLTHHCYDLYKCHGSHVAWFREYFEETLEEDEDFLPVFRKATRPFAGVLSVHPGDVAKMTFSGASGIGLCSLDVCKSIEITLHVFREFLPHLKPGAWVLNQDLMQPYAPWLVVATGYFSDHLETAYEAGGESGTMLHRVRRAWTGADADALTAVLETFSEATIACFDRGLSLISRPRNRAMCRLGRAQLVAAVRGREQGLAEIEAAAAEIEAPSEREHIETMMRMVESGEVMGAT